MQQADLSHAIRIALPISLKVRIPIFEPNNPQDFLPGFFHPAKEGVDTAIEAVGIPVTFEICESIVAPGDGCEHRGAW